MQLLRQQIAFDQGLRGVKGDARKKGDVFEARDQVHGRSLYLGLGGDGGGERCVYDGDIVERLHGHLPLANMDRTQ